MCTGLAQGYREPEKKMSLLKPYTNNDKINDMSIEEKIDFMFKNNMCINLGKPCNAECKSCIKQWLESEAEE